MHGTCFHIIIEQGDEGGKALVIFTNKSGIRNTLQEFKIENQTFVFKFFTVSSIPPIAMGYNWTQKYVSFLTKS